MTSGRSRRRSPRASSTRRSVPASRPMRERGMMGGAAFLTNLPHGRLADNILHFVRLLRAAGLPAGPAKVLDALAAVQAVGVDHREDFREALAAVLVSRREHLVLFE